VNKHAARWAIGLLKYGIGFGLLAFVIYRYWDDRTLETEDGQVITVSGLGTLLQGPIEYGWLVVSSLLIAGALSLQLVRWYFLVRALDLPFTLRNAFRLGLVGVFYNTFFPGSVGGDLVKAFFIAREHPERKTRAVATVIMDRALGLFGLILFTAVLGSIAWADGDPRITANPKLQWLIKTMAVIAGASIAGFLLLGLLPQRRVDRFARRLKWFPKVGGSLAEFWYAVWMYRQRLRTVVLGVGLSALAHFALVFAFHTASRVFPPANPGEQATLAEHMVIAPMGFIVQALPLTPGGVGVGEAAFAGLYKLCGLDPSRGVIARLAMRVGEWIIALIGYIVFLRMRAHHELPTVEEENGEPPPEEGKEKLPPDDPG
jgi:glycosyltransferase 2 family protein